MAKRLVLCFDGTWNDPASNTNVSLFHDAVRELPATPGRLGQVRWYDPGVGTELGARLLGGGAGVGLSQNMLEGYQLLGQSYEDGDQIFILGFSRGAYTARCLAALIARCGVLAPQHADDHDLLVNAYLYYKMRGDNGVSGGAAFCGAYGRAARIRFVGVWDTVGALGVPGRLFQPLDEELFGFVDRQLCASVDFAYHAMAVDEHRYDFRVTPWDGCAASQVMEQRWFIGDHCDVGGGHGDDRTLADIPLRWMMERAIDAGLELNAAAMPPNPKQRLGGVIHDTYGSPGWQTYAALNPRYRRRIAAGIAGQVVDGTVYERRSADPRYRPENVGLRPL